MINRECLDWDLWNWTEALIFRSNFGDVCIMIPGKEKAVSSWWKPISEVDSHRNSPGSNEKKMLNSLPLLLKNITSSLPRQPYWSCRTCLQMVVSTMLAFKKGLGNHLYIVVLKIFPQGTDMRKAREITLRLDWTRNKTEVLSQNGLDGILLIFFGHS